MRAFLTKYNLDGKKVIPFATNAGWLGQSFEEIKELCPNAQNEMNIVFGTKYQENKLVTKESDIDNWIDSLAQ